MDRSTMENGFVSSRADGFPAGLRVLVVDDDPTWLKILEKMLKKCSYEVTTCCLARDALDILRGRKDGFDIVISDVNMPDMDGFKLLELVGLEMDLPVIMMSVDGETSRVMKGVQHGACDYLLKPVRMKELKNIWQHVFRKKIHEVKDMECYESSEDILLRNGSHSKFDEGYLLSTGCDISSGKKRKEIENIEYDDQEFSDTSSVKKARVVWSVDLHQKFVNAVNQIGLDKVGPKKILDLMNVPWLTRENVASHLQKYRLYLSRLQKPNDSTTLFCGIKQQDSTSKDQPASFSIQSSTPVHQKGAASSSFGYTTQVHQNSAASSSFGCTTQVHQNGAASSSFGYSNKNVVVQNVGSGNHEGDLMGIISFLPATESKNTLHADLPDPQKASNRSPLGLSHSYGPVQLDANNISFGSSQKHPWDREIPMVQLIKQPKQELELELELEQYGYSHLPLPTPHQNFQAECLQPAPATNLKPSITECDKAGTSDIKGCADYRSNPLKSPIEQIVDPFFVQAETATATPGDFVSTSTIIGLPSVKSSSFDQNWTSIWESDERNLIAGSGPTLLPTQADLPLSFLQDYGAIENVELNNLEFSDYHDPGLSAEVPSHLYDRLRFNFNSEFLCEPVTDHSLFIA